MGDIKAGNYEEVTVAEALVLLQNTGNATAEIVNLISNVIDKEGGKDLKCIHAKYSLLDYVSKHGVPYLPGGKSFSEAPGSYMFTEGFPFGFVVKNALSVEVPNTLTSREDASRICLFQTRSLWGF